MDIRNLIRQKRTYFDGGMGTLLQSRGLKSGELPEFWNLSHPSDLVEIHLEYLKAGADFITANTFGANCLKFDNLEEIITAGIRNAKKAIELFGEEDKFVAFDIGPLGKMLKPLGDLAFEEAVEVFAKSARIAEKAGADLFIIETMNDTYEQKAAVLACRENSSLPVFATNAFDENGRLMTGADPLAVIAMLEGLGVDALGVNCSLGPKQLEGIVDIYLKYSSLPVIVNPNAGMPKVVDGKTVFDVNNEEFSEYMSRFGEKGVCVLGGCCGTTPEYIRKTKEKTVSLPFEPPKEKNITVVSSYTHAVVFDETPVLIGERINPTGKKRFKQALKENDIDYIIGEGINQQNAGSHVLDVNVGLPEIDEKEMLKKVVFELQSVSDLPLQIDTSDPSAMESALRIYNGKAMVNSVNGKKEVMDSIFPLVKKYGGVVIGLTLDENGIPETSDGRFAIAERIISEAEKHGIFKKDIIIDPLAMTISSDRSSARVTLESVRKISEKLKVKTSLGVSNVSFGLPNREIINSVFLSLAFENGLNAAIINPFSLEMMKAYHSYVALSGMDEGCADYIRFASTITKETDTVQQKKGESDQGEGSMPLLVYNILKGRKQASFDEAKKLLSDTPPLDIINDYIVPALNEAGKRFEEKTLFLPQLLMSAEAAGAAFEAVKALISGTSISKETVVLATVEGDIHDIGKNIVKTLLENYGYKVIDLGKDVSPERIVEAVSECGAPLVGLSALMTTTVGSMEETIRLLREKCPEVKVMVGGAVLTQEYADAIGADSYSKDAMGAVRYAEKLFHDTE